MGILEGEASKTKNLLPPSGAGAETPSPVLSVRCLMRQYAAVGLPSRAQNFFAPKAATKNFCLIPWTAAPLPAAIVCRDSDRPTEQGKRQAILLSL